MLFFSDKMHLVNIKISAIFHSGQAAAYTFDELTGGLVLSHQYVLPKKDYPGNILKKSRKTSNDSY